MTRQVPQKKKSSLHGLRVGQKLRGIVDGAESYGIFLKFLHKKNIVSGLCHISNMDNRFIQDPRKEYPVGTWLNTKIIKLDHEKERVSVTLKGLNTDKKALDRALLDEDTGADEKAPKGPTSEFVTSLSAGGAAPKGASGDDEDAQKKKAKAVLALLTKAKAMVSGGKQKNRLGQRTRKKLNALLYGFKQDPDAEKEATPAAGSAKKSPNPSTKSARRPSQDTAPEDAQEAAEDLHPSWAAKRKVSKPVAFQGTRTTFD
mmetsp:Transcript_12013/g.23609  ORF Transcript_12013/g.23609 Transcript_12013/m.23609 type:complete len:259 (-) Transcript_12013:91-867(-)